jgi:hypothetical protein
VRLKVHRYDGVDHLAFPPQTAHQGIKKDVSGDAAVRLTPASFNDLKDCHRAYWEGIRFTNDNRETCRNSNVEGSSNDSDNCNSTKTTKPGISTAMKAFSDNHNHHTGNPEVDVSQQGYVRPISLADLQRHIADTMEEELFEDGDDLVETAAEACLVPLTLNLMEHIVADISQIEAETERLESPILSA